MTAEVAILNRKAVVMAADSAISVPSNSTIYYTASKIFTLSLNPPMAVMIYGAASFGSIPWESVVKEYKQTSYISSSKTVQDHASNFMKYLSNIAKHVSSGWQHQFIRNIAQQEIHQVFLKAVQAVLVRVDHIDIKSSDLHDEILTQVNLRIQTLQRVSPIKDLQGSTVEQQIQDAFQDWDRFLEMNYVYLASVDDLIRSRTQTMIKEAIMAAGRPWSSGIVIAGFGTDQWFPSLSHYILDVIIGGQPWFRLLEEVQISDTNPSAIRPFAQKAMIRTFMQGVHPDSRSAIVSTATTHNKLLTQFFLDELLNLPIKEPEKSSLRRKGNRVASHFVDTFKDDIDNILKKYSDPIVTTIASLPKEKMATIAEDLVNIASLELQVTPRDKTVGGPIDVAVLSKEDGLVWIKRKVYFPPELNFESPYT